MKKYKEAEPLTRKRIDYEDGFVCRYESNGESHDLVVTKKNDLHIYFHVSGKNMPNENFILRFAGKLRSLMTEEKKKQKIKPPTPKIVGLFDDYPNT